MVPALQPGDRHVRRVRVEGASGRGPGRREGRDDVAGDTGRRWSTAGACHETRDACALREIATTSVGASGLPTTTLVRGLRVRTDAVDVHGRHDERVRPAVREAGDRLPVVAADLKARGGCATVPRNGVTT